MIERRTPEAERAALENLIMGEGWAIVKEMVAMNYGPEAFERAFDAAMKELEPGDEPGQRAVATQVRASYLAARNVVALVEGRYAALKNRDVAPTVRDRFAGLRRAPKS